MATTLSTMAVRWEVKRAWRYHAHSAQARHDDKRIHNRIFRRVFNQAVRNGLEAWSELNLSRRNYLEYFFIG